MYDNSALDRHYILGMGIVYILLIPILLIDTDTISILLIDTGSYRYCYRYYLVQKYIIWKAVENVKLFYYCWTLATVLKFFSQ